MPTLSKYWNSFFIKDYATHVINNREYHDIHILDGEFMFSSFGNTKDVHKTEFMVIEEEG